MLRIRMSEHIDYSFISNCLNTLLDKTRYSPEVFASYFLELHEGKYSKTEVWIAENEYEKVGCITANKFAIPRYLGYGVEFEEIVILPEHQRKGYGASFIQQLSHHYMKDHVCRKICVKTNDTEGSGKLYKSLMTETDMIYYQDYLNKL
jgi:hypothetical protein